MPLNTAERIVTRVGGPSWTVRRRDSSVIVIANVPDARASTGNSLRLAVVCPIGSVEQEVGPFGEDQLRAVEMDAHADTGAPGVVLEAQRAGSARRAVSVSVFAVVVMPLVSAWSFVVIVCEVRERLRRGCSRSTARAAARAGRPRPTGRCAPTIAAYAVERRAPRCRTRSATSGSGRGRGDRRELALERRRRRVSAGGDLGEQRVERRGLARADRCARSCSRSVMVATSGDQLVGRREHDAAGLRRRFVRDLGERGEHPLRAERGRARASRRSCSRPLSVAIAGAAMPAARRQHERLRGVSGSATGASAVSRTTNRPTSICVSRSTVASSTGSTNAVRGSGIWPVAARSRSIPRRTPPAAARRGPRLRSSGRRSGRTARGGVASSRRVAARPDASDAGVERRVGRGLVAQTVEVSGPMPSVSGKLPARASSVAMSVEPSAGAHRGRASTASTLAVGQLERAGVRAARSTRRAAVATTRACVGSTTTIHVTNVRALGLGADRRRPRPGYTPGAVDPDAARRAGAAQPEADEEVAVRWFDLERREREREPACVVPRAPRRSPRGRSRCATSPSGGP